MKNIVSVLFLTVICFAYSQEYKGKVTYLASLSSDDFHNRIMTDSSLTKQVKDMELNKISSSEDMNFHLLFNGSEALFQAEFDLVTKKNLGYKFNRTGEIAQDHNVYYTNLETEEYYYQSFWTKEVLVNLGKVDWKLTKETKKIGEHLCYKATATINAEQLKEWNFMGPIIAWFTPEIPVPFGIQRFNGLPGLTLELTINYYGGRVFFKSTKIELNSDEKIKIKKPKGKKVSEEEYIKLIEKLNDARKMN